MNTHHLAFAASVVMGAVYAILALDPATLPLARAAAGNPSSMVPALVADSANPYRWADLAEACARAGQLDKARYAFQRALALSRDIPPILLRDANFHFQLDESDRALSSAARVLSIVPDYDSVLFQPALHAAGVRHHQAVAALPEVHHLKHLLHPRCHRRGGHAVQRGMKTQVLGAGQVVIQRRVLEHQADIAADGVPLGPHVAARHPGIT